MSAARLSLAPHRCVGRGYPAGNLPALGHFFLLGAEPALGPVVGLHGPRLIPMNDDSEVDRRDHRLFAIGDIHGCSTALRALIETIDPRPDDTIVTLGDVIDYGPDTRGVVEQLMALSQRCELISIMTALCQF